MASRLAVRITKVKNNKTVFLLGIKGRQVSYLTNAQFSQPQMDALDSALVAQDVITNKVVGVSTSTLSQPDVHSIIAVPAQPKSLLETGLDQQLVIELLAKAILRLGKAHLSTIANCLKLSMKVLEEVLGFMVGEHMVEIARRGTTDLDIEYQLTSAGKSRAREFMTRCSYSGPAPVTLEAYHAMVEMQSVKNNHVTKADIDSAFADIILNPQVKNQIGAAMNSGRPLFLYGPAGSGKTYLSQKLSRLLPGLIAVPHAIVVQNEIIQVYDALLHEQETVEPAQRSQNMDNRWIVCKRPVVITGGELTLDMLNLTYDSISGFYHSPPHFKANNGIFIVDDLGRQIVSPQDLMNRWVLPMEHAHDYLSLHTGYKFTVPFDVSLVFSTNLNPSMVADESFLRRLGYKIYIGPLSEDEYRNVFRRHAKVLNVTYDEMAFRYLVDHLHKNGERPMIACYARDLLNQIVDYAKYYGETPAMTQQALDRAWGTYFASDYAN